MSNIRTVISFSELYKEVKDLYPNITDLTNLEIENIQNQSDKDYVTNKTNLYLTAVIAATVFFIIAPFFLTKLNSSLSIITNYMMSNKGSYSEELIQTCNFSFGSSALAIIFYISLFPYILKFSFFSKYSPMTFETVNRSQSNFVLLSFVGAYIAIGLIGLLLYLNVDRLATFIAENYKYYILIPLSFITILILLFAVTLIIMFPANKLLHIKNKQTSNKRIDICIKLLKTLKKISKFENFYFLTPQDSIIIMENLRRISSLIKNYPIGFNTLLDNSVIENNFLLAGIEFDTNIINFISTKDSHCTIIKSSLITYLNIFLSGDLSALPKTEITINNEKIKKAKLIHYFLLGLYLTLPIIVIVILKFGFEISLDDYTQSLIKILYIIWASVGIISNPFIINDESKDLLKDIIKTLTGKG